MEEKFCTRVQKNIKIEAKFKPIFDGREQTDTKKVGYHWETCNNYIECGPKCLRHHDLFR